MADKVNMAAPMPTRTLDSLREAAAEAFAEDAAKRGAESGPLWGKIGVNMINADDVAGVVLVGKNFRAVGNDDSRLRVGVDTLLIGARSVPLVMYNPYDVLGSDRSPINLLFAPAGVNAYLEYDYDLLDRKVRSAVYLNAGILDGDPRCMNPLVQNSSKYYSSNKSNVGALAGVRHSFNHYLSVDANVGYNPMSDVNTNVLGNNRFGFTGQSLRLTARTVVNLDGRSHKPAEGNQLWAQFHGEEVWRSDENGGGSVFEPGGAIGGRFNLWGGALVLRGQAFIYNMDGDVLDWGVAVDAAINAGGVSVAPYYMAHDTRPPWTDLGSSKKLTDGDRRAQRTNLVHTAGVKVTHKSSNIFLTLEGVHTSASVNKEKDSSKKAVDALISGIGTSF